MQFEIIFCRSSGNTAAVEVQRGSVRLTALKIGAWLLYHWTPFNDLSPDEASSPGYRHAVERQNMGPDLPYGFEVWHGTKLLCVLWADSGAFEVARFIRGSWEDKVLAL